MKPGMLREVLEPCLLIPYGNRRVKIATVIDRTLRACAALAGIVAVPLVFLVGIMANDAGTPTSAIGGLIILGVGGSLVGWILFCSFRPAVAAGWLGSSDVL